MATIPANMDSKLDLLIQGQRETLDTLKRLADTQGVKINHLESELKDIWKELEKATEARRTIYDRLEQQSRTCAGRHGLIDERSHKDGRAALKDIAYSAWGVIGAAILGGIGTQVLLVLLRK